MAQAESAPFEQYKNDPVGYVTAVLQQSLTPAQEEALRSLTEPPYVTLCPSGNNVGKSFVAACAVSWWFDTRKPALVLTTAPTERQVEGILWRELRKLRRAAGLGGFAGPRACRMEAGDDKLAIGITARDETSFQGWHAENVLVVLDEAEGVRPEFWEAAHTILGGTNYALLATYNPTTQDSQASQEELLPDRRVIRMSALEHPNIREEQEGRPAPFPAAIRLSRLRSLVLQWCDVIGEGDVDPDCHDFPFEGQWWRPGLAACARVLGVRHSSGVDEVWSEGLWRRANVRLELNWQWPLQVGIDVAAFGDDETTLFVRLGLCAVHAEAHQGWPPDRTARRAKQLAHFYAAERTREGFPTDPRSVPVVYDLDGPGYGVLACAEDWHFVGVHAGSQSSNEREWHLKRSELWFASRDAARAGAMDLSRLPRDLKAELRRQLLGVKYTLTGNGAMQVEAKKDTKKRLKRSPDLADGLHLSFYCPPQAGEYLS